MNKTFKFILGVAIGGYGAYLLYAFYKSKQAKKELTTGEMKNFSGRTEIKIPPRNLIPSVYGRGIGAEMNFTGSCKCCGKCKCNK
jgi:hypothetical protein